MRGLISGAGSAGLALAPRLRQRSLAPVVVERAPPLRDAATCSASRTPGCSAGRYPSAEPGTACSAAWKPTFEWVPSQKGLVVDAPQRQSATLSRAG
jgi:succinate dehydrogenase/fumarate reductase flavoprotein subunit